MFDKETQRADPKGWKAKICNAILEKAGQLSRSEKDHGIVHLEAEETSNEGLVYLKCATLESATNAYRALHGWWCEKKLVSVKFLKDERYYQHYPAARACTTSLKMQPV